MTRRIPKPAEVCAALPDLQPRSVGAWLRGERSPDVEVLARILDAFPHLDGRWLVGELARLWKAKRPT